MYKTQGVALGFHLSPLQGLGGADICGPEKSARGNSCEGLTVEGEGSAERAASCESLEDWSVTVRGRGAFGDGGYGYLELGDPAGRPYMRAGRGEAAALLLRSRRGRRSPTATGGGHGTAP